MKRIDPFLVLEELYGLPRDELIKLDSLCKQINKKLNWYDLFYTNEVVLFMLFPKYIVQKYKLKPKNYWLSEIRKITLFFGPTANKIVHENAMKQARQNKEILEILHKAKMFSGENDERR